MRSCITHTNHLAFSMAYTCIAQFGSDQQQCIAKPGVGFPTVQHSLLPDGMDATSAGSGKAFPVAQGKNFNMD